MPHPLPAPHATPLPRRLRAIRHLALGLLLAAGLGLAQAQARPPGGSEASAVSAMPVAALLTAPALLLSGTAVLTVAAVEASADRTVWVLEGASDGSRHLVQLAGGASLAVGSSVQVTAVAAGWVLSQGGRVLALLPNALGQALMHHAQVAR